MRQAVLMPPVEPVTVGGVTHAVGNYFRIFHRALKSGQSVDDEGRQVAHVVAHADNDSITARGPWRSRRDKLDQFVYIIESDLVRARTIEGLAEARRQGRIPGRPSKLTALQQKRLYDDYHSGKYTAAQLMELYPLKRAALYATIDRERERRVAHRSGNDTGN